MNSAERPDSMHHSLDEALARSQDPTNEEGGEDGRDPANLPAHPWTDVDHYVPRPDVPGHSFTRIGELRGSSYGYSVHCSCGAAFDWVVSSAATAVENRHRIEVSS